MLSFTGRNKMDRPWPCDSAIRIKSFNDATPNIEVDLGAISSLKEIYVHWRFDAKNWEKEMFQLMCVVDAIGGMVPMSLYLPYIPNARMDRMGSDPVRALTLKTFAKVINGMNFKKVYVLDPHSDVATALIDNCEAIYPHLEMSREFVMDSLVWDDAVWVFPDAGAEHRYMNIPPANAKTVIGAKTRDWETQHITGYVLNNAESLRDKSVIVMDDIVSHGYTLLFLLREIQKHMPGSITILVTHMEESFKDGELYKALARGEIKAKVVTTDSICRSWSDGVPESELEIELEVCRLKMELII